MLGDFSMRQHVSVGRKREYTMVNIGRTSSLVRDSQILTEEMLFVANAVAI